MQKQNRPCDCAREMETSVPGVYAAGDCCTVDPTQQEPFWFQIRLWTQVRGQLPRPCMPA